MVTAHEEWSDAQSIRRRVQLEFGQNRHCQQKLSPIDRGRRDRIGPILACAMPVQKSKKSGPLELQEGGLSPRSAMNKVTLLAYVICAHTFVVTDRQYFQRKVGCHHRGSLGGVEEID